MSCFSPLHEGDTSVAIGRRHIPGMKYSVSVPLTRGTPPWPCTVACTKRLLCPFQSPSRGGHLRGPGFQGCARFHGQSFSPLHEGDTSVAVERAIRVVLAVRFSPLHEGDTSVARRFALGYRSLPRFQSPSRGGHLRGFTHTLNIPLYRVSVPFTRGTPPWPLHYPPWLPCLLSFSPLHEGDTSVAFLETLPDVHVIQCFSPLHEGDTSVARLTDRKSTRLNSSHL